MAPIFFAFASPASGKLNTTAAAGRDARVYHARRARSGMMGRNLPTITRELMMNCRGLFQASFFLALGLIAAQAFADNPNPNQTYVTVNGHAIPKSRADAMATSLPPARGPQEAEAMRRALGDELVWRELVAQEAAKRGMDRRPDVRARMELAMQGVLVSTYLSEYVKDHPVSDAALKREYEAIRATLGNQEYKVRHILLGSEAEANAVIGKLGHGAKFNDLVAQSTDRATKDRGGDLGWINAATYVRPFADAMVKLQKGSHTMKPVQSEFGWHVIQLDDVRELKPPTLAEAKPRLMQQLQQQAVERHLADLRAKAKVE